MKLSDLKGKTIRDAKAVDTHILIRFEDGDEIIISNIVFDKDGEVVALDA